MCVCVCVCVCECVCVRERERKIDCVWERKGERVAVISRMRERERECYREVGRLGDRE